MQKSRLIPFTIAGLICFAAAFVLGAVSWYFFGTKTPAYGGGKNTIVQTSNQNQAVANASEDSGALDANANQNSSSASFNAAPAAIKSAPAGEAKVTGGEVTLGGGDTKLPLRRVSVSDFAIGETEVTNSQYAEFIEAAKYRAPFGWKDGKFPEGTENLPVVGITWADANYYCDWLGKELGATVRLPTEAEWERAARGDNVENKYPWGNDWSDEAVQINEAKGKIFAVKSANAGRSPFGAYEMVGNVWEWTSDLAMDEFGKPIFYGKSRQRVIKGGSVKESALKPAERDKFLTVDTQLHRPENKASELLGFRYVVIRGQ